MYIKKIIIENVKSVKALTMDFDTPYAGWHVLLGDNGSGKSSILKAISLCLIGERQGYSIGLKENFKSWITIGHAQAYCKLDILLSKKDDDLSEAYDDNNISFVTNIKKNGNIDFTLVTGSKKWKMYPDNYSHGWYNAAFGPFRRLGERESKKVSKYTDGNLENHITLFDANYNLSGSVQWLMDLKFAQLTSKKRAEQNLFDRVVWFINHSGLLPNAVAITDVDHEGVYFMDGDNKNIDINVLSDGYQSVFGLTIEILRQLTKSFPIEVLFNKNEEKPVINVSGIILIDEIDIHLHPQWQAKIGEWFKRCFPKMQFIVSTHSPIICQSAAPGSIWKIEHSKTGKKSHRITGQEYKRMVYGSITDAFSTDNFGENNVERSQESQEMLDRLALLNMKSIKGKASVAERKELEQLKSILPSGI